MDLLNKNQINITSVYLVEQINLFRSEENNKKTLLHKSLLAKIESEFSEEIEEQIILPSSYLGKNNKNEKCYELNFEQSLQLLMAESKTVRKKCVNVIVENNKPPETPKLPTTYLEALKELVIKEEKILMLEVKNEKLQYRSDFVDICFDTDGVFKFNEVAKILKLGYGSVILYEKKRKYGLIMKGSTIPYQKYINNGYFKVVENIVDAGKFKRLVAVTYATQKGIGYIKKLLTDNNE